MEDVLIGPDWKYFSLLFVFASRGPFFVRLAAAGDQFPTLLRDKVDFRPREGGKEGRRLNEMEIYACH